MAEQDPNEALEFQMKLGKEFIKSLRRERLEDGERVVLYLSLFGAVANTEDREELFQSYEAGLREAVPMMIGRLESPLTFSDPEDQEVYNAQMEEAITDALKHIRAVLDGTHRWSPRLAKSAPNNPADEVDLKIFSCCNIGLSLRLTNPVENTGVFAFYFFALLYDRSGTGPDTLLRAEDSDPQASNE